jgi:hypothetical protein
MKDHRFSFLNFSQAEKTEVYTVKKIRTVTLMQVIHDEVECVLNQQFIQTHREQLCTYLFEFEVTDKYKKIK